ncbi:MAG: hypothetical protein Q9224_007696, partial [Gallowayella concinna]
ASLLFADEDAKPPSSSQTRNSSPCRLTETALPRPPTCAPETEEMWPNNQGSETVDGALLVARRMPKVCNADQLLMQVLN